MTRRNQCGPNDRAIAFIMKEKLMQRLLETPLEVQTKVSGELQNHIWLATFQRVLNNVRNQPNYRTQ